MSELTKYRWHLLLIGLLALAKFLWLPLWQEKQEMWQQGQSFRMNSAKYQQLLQQEEALQTRSVAAAELAGLVEAEFPRVDNLTSFKLSSQSAIEELFNKAQLSVSMSSWRNGVQFGDIDELYLDINLEGELNQYLQMLQALAINSDVQGTLYQENIQLSARGEDAGTARVRGRLTFSYRYLLVQGSEGQS